ncbi:MAG: hypothetical protein GX234_08415 [Clostridiales bacterium]|nr:hypothetical protein [Clostridiales bacterium]
MWMIFGVAAVLLVLWFVLVWIRDINRFVIVEYKIEAEGLKKPFTFQLLSDLHNKAYGKRNGKLAEAVLQIPADAILVAGDMYTSKSGTGFEHALELFEQICRKCPVYYANGNHEHKTRVRPDIFGRMYEEYWKEMEKLGIRPLSNEQVCLSEYGIHLYGLELGRDFFKHFQKRPFPDRYLEQLLGERKEEGCNLLIAHNPDYFPEYAKWGADVVVSGHVHGGVVRLPVLGGVLSPALHLFPKYDGGEFHEGSATMILGRGLGMHTIPVRMWNPAELVVVHLVPKK